MIPAIGTSTSPNVSELNLAAMPMETKEQALKVFRLIGQQLRELTLANRALQNKNISVSELFGHSLRINHLAQVQEMLLAAHPTIAMEQIENSFIKSKL